MCQVAQPADGLPLLGQAARASSQSWTLASAVTAIMCRSAQQAAQWQA